MRLKYLELQGYKTFASRTRFVLDGRITAIVGPNGSGKSNVADAIRWVLGEQSYRALRGKRTEDMIFSGSSQRARLGMASASLVFDNVDGWFPIDFGEVGLTRRAYRSGENEYQINSHRVRLGDITELLSKSGLAQRTYAVIGQGLVDAVLSLRPDDRRALFEEAAGIAVYRAKRSDAVTRLEETRSNLVRVNDIVAEIAPRLQRLQREAERARLHGLLSQQLETMLRTWHGYRWHQVQLDLGRARDALARRESRVIRQQEMLRALQERMTAHHVRQSQLREQLSGWHREGSELHRQMEEVQRDTAVRQERARLLRLQDDEVQRELAALALQARAIEDQIGAAERDLQDLESALLNKEASVEVAKVELDRQEAQRDEMARKVAEVQSCAIDLAAQTADRRSRLAQIGERRAEIESERGEHLAALKAAEAERVAINRKAQAVTSERDRIAREGVKLADEAARLDVVLSGAIARESELSTALVAATHGVQQLQARYEWLGRLRDEGEGFSTGVHAVLQRARANGKLPEGAQQAAGAAPSGIVGTVAELIGVPEDLEVAVEAALGGHLQDIVAESWHAAEAAINFLSNERSGRATFLPLDTLRPAPRMEALQDPEALGVAADLVTIEGHLRPVLEVLLGRTVIVQSLAAARRVFEHLQGGFQVVTVSGELLHSTGSVTGGLGSGQQRGTLLAREREWRELPQRIAVAQRRVAELESGLVGARTEVAHARSQRDAVAAQQHQSVELSAELASQLQKLEREADRATQRIAWGRAELAELEGQAAELDGLESTLRLELTALTAQQEACNSRLSQLAAELNTSRGEGLYRTLSDARTAAAVARRTWEHRSSALDAQRDVRVALEEQLESRRQRMAGLHHALTELSEQLGSQASREAVIQGWLSALAQKIEPAEADIARLDTERERLGGEEAALRARLREAESSFAQAQLARSRHEDRRQRLRRQILDDFGLVEMEQMEGQPDQPPLPLAEMVSVLPVVEALPQGLEEDIHQLRAQIKRMGSVNPHALDDYTEVLNRHTFLTTQAADLEDAVRHLREAISELDGVMRHEFERTFEAVAARFEANFTQLFGGGTAHLTLTEPDDMSTTGVDIVARPPGKRQQTLASLSGGERALTAVALVFAFLQTNPPPFCILDEVDAMLDEVNVQRFRDMLELLSEQTQFIVITHNRTTIQAADTIYGVSMGEDSVSQVVSLRWEGDRIVRPGGARMDLTPG